MRKAASAPTPSQMSCRCQMVVTKVGTSVCPAEYSVTSPQAASVATTPASGLSISRSRGRRGRVRASGGDRIGDGGVLDRRPGEDRCRVRGRIGRWGVLDPYGRGGIDDDVA